MKREAIEELIKIAKEVEGDEYVVVEILDVDEIVLENPYNEFDELGELPHYLVEQGL